jgi:hypothetical protein
MRALNPEDRAGHTKELPEKSDREPRGPTLERQRPGLDLTNSQRDTIAEIGRFRTLSISDLTEYRYANDAAEMQHDIRRLSSQKLVRTRSIWLGKEAERLTLVSLTKAGKRVLEQGDQQGVFYAGFVKPAEMAHDAAIYRVYQTEAARIRSDGGQIRRITLDYELKRSIYSPLAKERPGTAQYKKRQVAIATEHGLKVVRGTFSCPTCGLNTRREQETLSERIWSLQQITTEVDSWREKLRQAFHFMLLSKMPAGSAPSSMITISQRRSSLYEFCCNERFRADRGLEKLRLHRT